LSQSSRKHITDLFHGEFILLKDTISILFDSKWRGLRFRQNLKKKNSRVLLWKERRLNPPKMQKQRGNKTQRILSWKPV
jgi:hypothetical protein